MPLTSANLGLTLPESFDKVDVGVLSNNFSLIDEAMGTAISGEEIANNLTTTSAGKVLDARQGKVLSDKINTKLDKTAQVAVVNNLTTTDSTKALSAAQGPVIQQNINARATTAKYSATLSSTAWSSSVPHTQKVTVSGILATDTPFVDLDMSSVSTANALDTIDAWGLIGRIVTSANAITAYCYDEVPEVNLKLNLKVVR